MAEIVIHFPDGRSMRQPLTLKPLDIGRDAACAISIDHPSVSRRHAEIRGDKNGRFSIRDLGSKNGTLVNHIPISTHELAPNDEITWGVITAKFLTAKEACHSSSVFVDDQTLPSPQALSAVGQKTELHLSQQRLQILYDISERLTSLRNRQELLSDIMQICIEMFGFERAAIAIKRPNERMVDWPVVHNLRQPDGEIKLSRTILKQALEEGQRVIFSDQTPAQMDMAMSIVQQGMRSAMCVPITYSEEILGVIYGDRTSSSRIYQNEDVDFLAALGRQVGIGLANVRLLQEKEIKTQLESEIAIARQIQADLFPTDLDLHRNLDIAAINDPGRQVSGDYYDVIPMPDGRVGIIVADVSGKGVASSLLAANLQAAVRILFLESVSLSHIVNRLNWLVYHNTDVSRFITAIVGIIDPFQHTIDLISAGHFFPICVYPDGRVQTAEADCHLPLGVKEQLEYRSEKIRFDEKESVTLIFYSDGLSEALNEQEEQFGEERILATLQRYAALSPGALINKTRQTLTDFCGDVAQSDDITILACEILKE